MKRLEQALRIFLGCWIRAFLGDALWRWADYRAHPEIHAMNSAPWYTAVQINAVLTLIVAVIILVVLRYLKRKH